MKKKIRILLLCFILSFSGYTFYSTLVYELVYDPYQQMSHQHFISRIPEVLVFAGEPVHFKTAEAYQNYYRELRKYSEYNSSTRLLTKNIREYLLMIEDVLKAKNIPSDFKYVAIAESNLSNLVSNKGAVGFWQLKKETAIELGMEVNEEVDERYDPLKSTIAACKYFKQAYKVIGRWTGAAASYNRGLYGYLKALDNQRVNTYYDLALNKETASYIYKILAIKDIVENPEKYGMTEYKKYYRAVKKVEVDSTIHNLNQFARHFNVDYYTFKEYNPWLLSDKLTIKESPRKKSYTIYLPPGSKPFKAIAKDTTSHMLSLLNR